MNDENYKKRYIAIAISILVVAAITLTTFMVFFNKKDKVDLAPISNKLFEEHMDKLLNNPEKKNIQASYNVTSTKIVAGNSKEFVAEIYYDLTATEVNNTETTQFIWTVRIKKSTQGKYLVVAEGTPVNTKGLKLIKDTSKATTKKSTPTPISPNSAYKYAIKGNKISVTYNNGVKWVDVPLLISSFFNSVELANIDKNHNATLEDGSYYITPKKTAFIHGGNGNTVKVTISDNQGESWYTFEIPGTAVDYDYDRKFVGFTTQLQGYVLLTSSVAMGHQENIIYETNDGGKTWNEIGNTNKVYARVVTGAGFATDKIGLVGFRYENDNNPTIYRTTDSGNTWEKVNIRLPSQYSNDYATPLCPVFKGAKGMLPVKLRDANKTIQFITNDYGETWEFYKDVV